VWFTDSYPEAEIDAEVLATLQETVEKLRNAGIDIDEEARPDIDLGVNLLLWRIIVNNELELGVTS